MLLTRLQKLNFILFFVLISALITASYSFAGTKDVSDLGENEIKMGKEAVQEILKSSKLSENEADIARVRKIGNKIAETANKYEIQATYGSSRITPFQYTFQVIEDPEVNAFCVPGGFVFINSGLLDFVQSDDELAGVIAHEITHAAHHHMVYLIKEQSSAMEKSALVILASIFLGGNSADVNNVVFGAQLYQIARTNDYGRNAERDADRGAVQLMTKCGYNAVGMLTFLERLAKKPELVDLGIYRSHPADAERIANVKGLINTMGLPIERWRTIKGPDIEVKTAQKDGTPAADVYLDGHLVVSMAQYGDIPAEQRAYEASERLSEALKANLQMFDVNSGNDGILYIRKQPIISFTEADAKKAGKTPAQTAADAAQVVRAYVWKLALNTIH